MISGLKKGISALGLKPVALKMLPTVARAMSRIHRFHDCTRNGVSYRLDLRELLDANIFFIGEWEPATCRFLRDHLKPGDNVIEVGANIGAHTLLIARLCHPGKVFAFEATSAACAKLRTNLVLNPTITNVTLTEGLITDHQHSAPKLSIQHSWPLNRASNGTAIENVAASAIALDDVSEVASLTHLALLKVDVDGYDYKVLDGATRIIQRLRPWIFVEMSEPHLREVGDSSAKICSLMNSLNYQLHSLRDVDAIFKPI